jgi:hypothetical protein
MADTTPKSTKASVSLTFQSTQDKKERLEAIAYEMGFRRVVDEAEVGNMSLMINLAIGFMLENVDLFKKWMIARRQATKK